MLDTLPPVVMVQAAILQTRSRALSVRSRVLEVASAGARATARARRTTAVHQLHRAKALRDRAGIKAMRAMAAEVRISELLDMIRRDQLVCVACRQILTTSRGVLFQDAQLVHAGCWRADTKPLDEPPRDA